MAIPKHNLPDMDRLVDIFDAGSNRLDRARAASEIDWNDEKIHYWSYWENPMKKPDDAPQLKDLSQIVGDISRETQEKLADMIARHGWVAWGGGKCPIPREANRFLIMLRAGEPSLLEGRWASGLRWTHINTSSDIIAYKIDDAEPADRPCGVIMLDTEPSIGDVLKGYEEANNRMTAALEAIIKLDKHPLTTQIARDGLEAP